MALETLKGILEIEGFKVVRERGDLSWSEFDDKRKEFPINITEEKGMISFKIQDGPIKENGINGCQLTTLISTAKIMLESLNKKFPCRENSITITKLEEALMWQSKRTEDRILRNVEGTSKS
jgi:hypothetical protein